MLNHRDKIMTWRQAKARVAACQEAEQKVVFTNGCFDFLHLGHLRYLTDARNLGDFLVIGLNSDRSTREIKGPTRPIMPEDQRAEILAGLNVVDAVVIFDEPDPLELITFLLPDVLVKGGDWPLDKIIGREVVEQNGGTVLTIPLTPEVSTSAIINRILELNRADSKE
ncbi:MAG: D-glycero-beta-D-manno-heptose 1-phosphate adenylyltransferase [Deltaproteobacteria bacterium]|nr:D-glycero-beta-D-manno-heptose 1-phosphate adenylyltransferase [Deltaproteobacteria bacterium]MBW2084817.1 D-glycero-beta-D-manno-heptose 1-phosphate adenylyltransferase [Deltaproteobacteria bacterium]